MSYDLYFWREAKPLSSTPEEMMNLLQTDGPQPGLAFLPITKIKHTFQKFFPNLTDEGSQLWWEGAGSSFNVGFGYWDEKHAKMFVVMCGYKLLEAPETMNRIIEVGHCLGCALYDPKENKRFQQPD